MELVETIVMETAPKTRGIVCERAMCVVEGTNGMRGLFVEHEIAIARMKHVAGVDMLQTRGEEYAAKI